MLTGEVRDRMEISSAVPAPLPHDDLSLDKAPSPPQLPLSAPAPTAEGGGAAKVATGAPDDGVSPLIGRHDSGRGG
jgi:hypothetical protein